VFDTAAGELAPSAFREHVVPDLRQLASVRPQRLGYFARALHPAHLAGDGELGPWAGIGLDWRWDLSQYLAAADRRGFVQGNFDPALLHLTGAQLRDALREFLEPIAALTPDERRGWVCGLGHGILPGTPEESVATFVQTVRERLS
jgi:uroporphyrinogen decarboxylase